MPSVPDDGELSAMVPGGSDDDGTRSIQPVEEVVTDPYVKWPKRNAPEFCVSKKAARGQINPGGARFACASQVVDIILTAGTGDPVVHPREVDGASRRRTGHRTRRAGHQRRPESRGSRGRAGPRTETPRPGGPRAEQALRHQGFMLTGNLL